MLAEQIVDIPVPRGRGRWRRSSRPGQGSTAPSQQIVDTPVPRGGLQGFRQGQVLALHLQFLALRIERFMDFFRTFPGVKKSSGSSSHCGVHPAGHFSPAGVAAERSSWTPVAYELQESLAEEAQGGRALD